MSTYTQRRASEASAPVVRVALEDLLKSKVSMMNTAMLPAGYGDIETAGDAADAAFNQEDDRVVRMYIVWDNPIKNLELQAVLDHMRETGAAMVTKVEAVK